ncbi:RNA polymerase II subunit A C-terminal domain phosphatase [Escovopsis weberi]|uniref:RNA polymerase II subunit A C-terminal domain phosphatase n=1 Tax=Escovopsis weberi TaxID=150374 RepID=A0A0N0RU35_ESCWE|nr:RNA polymerase II subunit A C-terminal domain phosphatase [Escovopsis weberi]
MYDKTVSLGSRLHYPITITKLLKLPGDAVKKQETILEYKFSWRRKIGEDTWTDETTYTEFDSPAEGILKEWRIQEGMVVAADMPCMMVEEACGHEVQIQGLCSLCGADMTETNWASEERDTDRAMINMTHDQTGLMVSRNVAKKAEHDAQRRLLRQRKLSLVVDLDQTIIHACIEPTVGEWQRDKMNPNHDAVKDVKSFQLNDDGPRGIASGCTYYIKLRPGLMEFLEVVSSMYELHVYTMGTRAYALNIARIVDPDKKLFGNRVISRDENGSITAKSLQRIFPVSTDMVVIIDDRADVWPMNRPNLIKVVPYDFFKGIGDINSSFLPKRQDTSPAAPKSNGIPNTDSATETPAPSGQVAADKVSPIAELARMGDSDEASLKVQAEEQEKTLEKQLTDRPLLHMQEELDKVDGQGTGDRHRQHLLSDDDEELVTLQDHLTDLHSAFFDAYDKRREERKAADSRLAPGSTKPRRKPANDDGVDLSLVPDIGDILDELKSNVLSGLVICLSGLVPLGAKIEESEIGMQALSFGAQVIDSVSPRITHLVVSTARPRTKKVQQAAKISTIKIVNQNWLADCLSQWRRLDESPYYLTVSDADRERSEESNELVSEAEDVGANMYQMEDFDDELREFLGLDDDDDDDDDDNDDDNDDDDQGRGGSNAGSADETDDDNSSTSTDGEGNGAGRPKKRGMKRKERLDVSDSDDDSSASVAGESALAKKQRISRSRGASALRSSRTSNGQTDAEDGEGDVDVSARATPAAGEDSAMIDADGGADFDEDELERELLAELEASGD